MNPIISQKMHHAVIFDLDGVITKTAKIHAKAWKQLFDPFLEKHANKEGIPFVPFDQKTDYLFYVDGKPRYQGIESFLQSRGIDLPQGHPDDSPENNTRCGLANKKNQIFLNELQQTGVDVYETSIELIKKLRKNHFKIALISSSKNCRAIIKKVGITDLFDTIIDGTDALKMKIKGKPAPDVFLEAATLLGVEPQHAVVIEDASSGVEAGRRGGFALVIGVVRNNHTEHLLQHGAHVVVKDLKEVQVIEDVNIAPNALLHIDAIKKECANKQLAIFLDYDGTLTPIVSHADHAILSDDMRSLLKSLAAKYIVAIISGRDRLDVEKKVGITGIFYAGSHGFDIAGPDDVHYEVEDGKKCLPDLEKAEHHLREKLSKIDKAWVERKRFSIAIHFRQVAPEREPEVETIVDAVHRQFPNLKKTFGKKIYELQPNIVWNKGKALLWLLKLLQLDREDVMPFYLGDDVTDEDGFRVLMGHGIGIAIQDEPYPTSATYTLQDPDHVQQFLEMLF